MVPLTDEQKVRLYHKLVVVCPQYGFTTEHTYEKLHELTESMVLAYEQGETSAAGM